MKVLVNSEIVERKEVRVDIEDRGYQFGDGVYEVINVYNGVPFTLKEHTTRLYRSAKEVGIEIKEEPEVLIQKILRVIERNDMVNGGLYLQVSRGVAPRAHQYPSDIEPTLIAYPLPYKEMKHTRNDGVSVITAEDLRWLRCDIKSLNLLYNIMIKQKANEAGVFEAILIRNGIVTEGTSSNVFIVKRDEIFTHPANNLILSGITRSKLLEIFDNNGWKCNEQEFSKQELLAADEVFVTSTTSEVVPVISIDGTQVGDGKAGSMTKQIQQAFSELVKREVTKRG
ncbi:D-amino-acid transaminase [Sutcliffiella deserti]|uniref:D-amino-acid transaminase n=1 Tax=Sutcliffiella deserti TaxID=2875501 RepID=UPI001CBD51C8|nr:D-amino-acid transaminase [Sutcliffiella deserti]